VWLTETQLEGLDGEVEAEVSARRRQYHAVRVHRNQFSYLASTRKCSRRAGEPAGARKKGGHVRGELRAGNRVTRGVQQSTKAWRDTKECPTLTMGGIRLKEEKTKAGTRIKR